MKSILALLLSFVCLCTYGQQEETPMFRYNGNEFTPAVDKFVAKHGKLGIFIGNYLTKKDFYLHDSLCNSGIALLKFKIEKSGNISSIACSKKTPVLLSTALKTALIASEKYWHCEKKTTAKWFVQPILYDYHMNCVTIKSDFYSLQGGIFEFDDDLKISNLDCIILDPMVTSSGVEEYDLIKLPQKD